MSELDAQCRHLDIRSFSAMRCCLACGVSICDPLPANREDFAGEISDTSEARYYHYANLNPELGQEVRLVVLLPGSPSDRIRCGIIHVTLNDQLNFEAVSYTWVTENGDDSWSDWIYCPGGTILNVTANCAAALRQTRYPTKPRRLWIDAICIDQTNTKERNHQVSLMGQIYSLALRVLISINGPLKHYSKALQYLAGDDDVARRTHECRMQLCYLKQRRWFSRVWVVQEIALARAAVMYVNKEMLPLSAPVIERFGSFQKTTGPIPGTLVCELQTQGGSDFLTCLEFVHNCQSTDDRDKVFGIPSLVESKFRHLVPVDYSASVAQVYAHAAAGAIVQREDLDVLRHLTVGNNSRESTDSCSYWPSWVPDFGKTSLSYKGQLERDTIGPWSSIVKFRGVNEMLACFRDSCRCHIADREDMKRWISHDEMKHEVTVRIKWLVQDENWPYMEVQALGMPQLRVRSHFVDIVRGNSCIGSVLPGSVHALEFGIFVKALTGSVHPSTSGNPIEALTWSSGYEHHQDNAIMCLRRCSEWLITHGMGINRRLSQGEYLDLSRGMLLIPSVFWALDHHNPDPEEVQTIHEAGRAEQASDKSMKQHFTELRKMETFQSFIEAIERSSPDSKIFASQRSIGILTFPMPTLTEQDAIYAIDGLRSLFVLRRTATGAFRIIGSCYLLGAFEFEKLHTPSMKGFWNDDADSNPYDGWSGMIDIC